MPNRELTQAGLNRVMWKMLAALGSKFTISDREVNRVNEDAIKVQYDNATKSFTLSLCKAPQEKSNIVLPTYRRN